MNVDFELRAFRCVSALINTAFEVANDRWTPEDFSLDVTFYDSVEKVRIQEKLLLNSLYERKPVDNGFKVCNKDCPAPNKKQ